MGHTVNMFCQTLKWLILSCSRWCLRWKVVIAMDTWWLACFQDTSDWPGWVTRHGKILKSGWILQCSLFIKYISQSFQMKHVQPGIGPAGRSGYRSWMDWASPLISAKKNKKLKWRCLIIVVLIAKYTVWNRNRRRQANATCDVQTTSETMLHCPHAQREHLQSLRIIPWSQNIN